LHIIVPFSGVRVFTVDSANFKPLLKWWKTCKH